MDAIHVIITPKPKKLLLNNKRNIETFFELSRTVTIFYIHYKNIGELNITVYDI